MAKHALKGHEAQLAMRYWRLQLGERKSDISVDTKDVKVPKKRQHQIEEWVDELIAKTKEEVR
jgi:hypothetical protein